MKKYILSTALTLALSSSSLAGKETSYEVDFYIGKTSLYSQKNFNSKVEGREFYKAGDLQVTNRSKVIDQIKTQGTITTPYSWNFLDLNHKIGGKFFFPIGSGFSLGLEIASINPLNFRFEDFTTSKYTARENTIEAMFNNKVGKTISKNNKWLLLKSSTSGYNYATREFKYFLTQKVKKNSTETFADIDEETLKLFNCNRVKSAKSKNDDVNDDNSKCFIVTNDGATYTSETKNTSYDDTFNSLKQQLTILAKKVVLEDLIIRVLNSNKGAEVRQAIKTAFITPSIRYNINLNDNFDVNIFAKIGGGFLSITEKSSIGLIENKDLLGIVDQKLSQTLELEKHQYNIIVKQEGVTFAGGLEASLIYNRSDAFSASLTFGVNAYGKNSKAFDYKLYKTDDATKADISLIQFEKASPEEKNKSWFGLVDAIISAGATIKL